MNKIKNITSLLLLCLILNNCACFNPVWETGLKRDKYYVSYYKKYGHYGLVEELPLPYISIDNKKIPFHRIFDNPYPYNGIITKAELDKLLYSNEIQYFYIAKRGEKIKSSKKEFMSYLNSKNVQIDNRDRMISKNVQLETRNSSVISVSKWEYSDNPLGITNHRSKYILLMEIYSEAGSENQTNQ